MKEFKVKLTLQLVAEVIKVQSSIKGVDPVEHLVEILGTNSRDLLSLAINSCDPHFAPEKDIKVGDQLCIKRNYWSDCKTVTVAEIDRLNNRPMFLVHPDGSEFGWFDYQEIVKLKEEAANYLEEQAMQLP